MLKRPYLSAGVDLSCKEDVEAKDKIFAKGTFALSIDTIPSPMTQSLKIISELQP